MAESFGDYVKQKRLELYDRDRSFSLRQVAQRIGVKPAYLSKIENNKQPPPAEDKIRKLAGELEEDPDLLLALAGKVSADLKAIILKHPELFAQLIRELNHRSRSDLAKLVREVRDGNW